MSGAVVRDVSSGTPVAPKIPGAPAHSGTGVRPMKARRFGMEAISQPQHVRVNRRARRPQAKIGTPGAWRSLVAHSAGGRKVAGSNPVAPIKRPLCIAPHSPSYTACGAIRIYAPPQSPRSFHSCGGVTCACNLVRLRRIRDHLLGAAAQLSTRHWQSLDRTRYWAGDVAGERGDRAAELRTLERRG